MKKKEEKNESVRKEGKKEGAYKSKRLIKVDRAAGSGPFQYADMAITLGTVPPPTLLI